MIWLLDHLLAAGIGLGWALLLIWLFWDHIPEDPEWQIIDKLLKK